MKIGMGALVKPSRGYTEMRGVITKLEHWVDTNIGKRLMVEVFWFNPRYGDPRLGHSEKESLEVV